MALGPAAIDAATFTLLRLSAGAVTLLLLARAAKRKTAAGGGESWASAVTLFAYAGAFSFAYLRLSAGSGALILFASVQATMISWGLFEGESVRRAEWIGLAIAFGGLVALTFPGLSAPDAEGAAMMSLAGVAWGIYSLLGRRVGDPLAATASNFARSLPLALGASLATLLHAHISARGALLAIASGSLASGVGYTLWYAALPSLPATRAAIVQLAVPVIAAAGGVLLLGESITPRLLGAGALVLGGVAAAVLRPGR